jgi:hypothetical protein
MRGEASLIALALVATVGVAHGDAELSPPSTTPTTWTEAPPAPTPARPRLSLAVSGELRVTRLDGRAARFVDDAMAYGWRDAAARPLLGGRLDVHYLATPIVDVGVSTSWMQQRFAIGVDEDDELAVRWLGLAASARLRWANGRPFVPEPRVDVGVVSARTSVHGTDDDDTRSYVRAGVDWRLGTRTAGVNLAVAYTFASARRGDGPTPPLGGLDLALGPYLRF